ACAQRELEEETGLRARSWRPLTILATTPGICNERIGIFLATDLEGGQTHWDEDEFLGVVRMPLKSAVDRVMSGEIDDSKTIAGLLMAWQLLGKA
ncbi:MAG TPA: NUDIX hydrolase, partial [Clostridia bacterium]|nr:NUDIX hydrolase [Clostridia bacterium]